MPRSWEAGYHAGPAIDELLSKSIRHSFCCKGALRSSAPPGEEDLMLHYALVFLVVALIAGVLGASGVAAVATNIAYVLFVIAIVLFLVHLLSGRRSVV